MRKFLFIFLIISLPLAAQETKLNYPYPIKQIESSLKLPEKLDTLNEDYFLIYQYKIKNGKAESFKRVHQYPMNIPSDYIGFAEEKLESFDFTNLVYDQNIEWYGISLQLKKKPVEYQKKSDIQLTYEEKFTWFSLSAARFGGLEKDDYDYMISKNYKDVLITVTVGTDGKMSFENRYENHLTNKDERYWSIYRKIVDDISHIRIWNEYKDPFIAEEDFSIYLNFYKKLEWKEK